MEEKEREQLKERLLKMVVNEPRLESMPPMTMAEVMVNSMSKPNLEPLLDFISQEIEKAREEGFDSGIEKTVDVIQEGLDELLLEKDGEKYWVGDILRDCGSSVEKMLPQNMKHYLVSKLKDNK